MLIPTASFSEDQSKLAQKFILDDYDGFLEYDEPKQGSANAKLVVEGGIIVMQVVTPIYNLHGVETPPGERTEQEKKQVEDETRNFLDSPQDYFIFDPANACAFEVDELHNRKSSS